MNACERIHRFVSTMPSYVFPFSGDTLLANGIILMYEKEQVWSHGGAEPRIVHVGSHRDGNLASRLSEQFILDDRKMDFTANGIAPKDRSILRKTIGRSLLNKTGDPYLAIWNVDYTKRVNRERYRNSRDVEKEKAIEAAVTDYVRSNFAFRVFSVSEERLREHLKVAIIASLAQCAGCCPTKAWLRNHAPDERVSKAGLWQVQHTASSPLSPEDFEFLNMR